MNALRQKLLISYVSLLFVLIPFAIPYTTTAAGVTVITHGFQLIQGEVPWTLGMADAIHEKWLIAGFDEVETGFGYIRVFDSVLLQGLETDIPYWDVGLSISKAGEIIIIINWSEVADYYFGDPYNTTEIAEAVVDLILVGQSGYRPLAELPIHLIGHSRGGSLVCELSRLLGERGLWVDHVTTLDPHPLDPIKDNSNPRSNFPEVPLGLIDADPIIYENALFADNYWQEPSFPDGRFVIGAYNRELDYDSLDAGGYDSEHSDTHLWYHGTIDTSYAQDVFDQEDTITTDLRTSWYIDDEAGGKNTGFRFSRIAEQLLGSVRNSDYTPHDSSGEVSSGYSVLVGGSGSRAAIEDKTNAVWPNLVEIEILRDGIVLGSGTHYISDDDLLEIFYNYLSYNRPWTVEFRLDEDINPYNGIGDLVAVDSGGPSVKSSARAIIPQIEPLSARSEGFYLCGKIYDSGQEHTRYYYAKPRMVFSCCQLRGDFDHNGLVGIFDLNFLVNDIFRGGPSADCSEEGDINGDGQPSTVLDLNYLVNDIFRGGPSPAACP